MDVAINQGRKQVYIEMVHEMKPENILEEEFSEYLEAKQQYEAEKNFENLRNLIEITEQIIEEIH